MTFFVNTIRKSNNENNFNLYLELDIFLFLRINQRGLFVSFFYLFICLNESIISIFFLNYQNMENFFLLFL